MRSLRRALAVPLALAAAASPAPAAAQMRPRPEHAFQRPDPRADPHRDGRSPLRSFFGVAVAHKLLASDDEATRIRGIERLGAIGTPEAIDALVEALEQGQAVGRSARARLTAVRVLAPHAKRDSVRQLLVREMTESGADARGVSPLSGIIRATAALSLAKSGEKKDMGALVSALLQGGASGEAASRALRAYPPASIEPFLEGRKRLTPPIATFLGELGDLRAVERLRAMLEEADQGNKVIAAVALAKLGDETPLPLAREWLKKTEPRLRRAAAEVLLALDAPEAGSAVAALIGSETTTLDGLRLAALAPSPDMAAALAGSLPTLSEQNRPRAIAALGRAGGPRAIQELTALLGKPDTATQAAFALATLPGDDARTALETASAGAKGDAARRLLLRAGIVRALALRDAPKGLTDALEGLRRAKDPVDRAVAAFGLVALGARSAEDVLGECFHDGAASGPKPRAPAEPSPAQACDAAVVAGAARGALARGARQIEPFQALLAKAAADPKGADAAVAAGVALLVHPDGGDISTAVLAGWAEAGGPLAPLAARALPSRDSEALRGRIARLLDGSDPVVRAHVALGLGADPEADSVSLLTEAYRFEDDAAVRVAIVRALAHRTEVQRTATLTLARDLDPDDRVRAIARSALEGRAPDDRPTVDDRGLGPRGQVAWVAIVANDAAEAKAAAGPPPLARLVRGDGIAVPVVADPDGVLLVPGLPPGASSLLLAPTLPPGDARPR
jgi:cellulose synthase operon protein C